MRVGAKAFTEKEKSSGLGILSPLIRVRTGHTVPRGLSWPLSLTTTLLPRVKKKAVYIVGEAGHVVPTSLVFLLKGAALW
jgi:hypothetical protein